MFASKAAKQRQKHVQSLKAELESIRAKVHTVRPDQEFRIDLTLGEEKTLIQMFIFLDGDFPTLPPHIRLQGPELVHHVLNDSGHVAYHEDLQRWDGNKLLGKVVLSILGQFRHQKPVLKSRLQGNNNNGAGFPPQQQQVVPQMGQPMAQQQVPQQQQQRPQPPPHRPAPQPTYVRPPEFDTLRDKTEAELEVLLKSQEAFEEWFGNLEEVKARTRELANLMQQNAELAGVTLSRQEEYNKLRQEVEDLRGQFDRRKQAFDAKYNQHHAQIDEAQNGGQVLNKLQAAINEADRESERTAEQFCEGDMPLQEFLRAFKEQRKLYHVRSAKKEMLQNKS